MRKHSDKILAGTLALLLALAGCGKAASSAPAASASAPAASEAASAPASAPAEPEPEMSAQPQPEGDPVLYVEPAVERFVAQRPDAIQWVDAEGEYAEKLVFTVTHPVTELELLAIAPQVAEDGTLYGGERTVLQHLDAFTDNDLLVLTTQFDGVLPTRALRFVDGSGNTQCWYLAQSGEDGMPFVAWLG